MINIETCSIENIGLKGLKKQYNLQFQFQHVKKLEVVTPILTSRKKLNRSVTLLGPIREWGCRASCHLTLCGEINTENHSWDQPTWSRSCWRHKLVGTRKWQFYGLLDAECRLAWGRDPGGHSLRRPLCFHGFHLQELYQILTEESQEKSTSTSGKGGEK